jgi:hypothetical protein
MSKLTARNKKITEEGEHNMRCVICKKRIKVRTWKAKKGILKGQTIISKVFCGKSCRNKFKLLIKKNDYEEARKKMNMFINNKINKLKCTLKNNE